MTDSSGRLMRLPARSGIGAAVLRGRLASKARPPAPVWAYNNNSSSSRSPRRGAPVGSPTGCLYACSSSLKPEIAGRRTYGPLGIRASGLQLTGGLEAVSSSPDKPPRKGCPHAHRPGTGTRDKRRVDLRRPVRRRARRRHLRPDAAGGQADRRRRPALQPRLPGPPQGPVRGQRLSPGRHREPPPHGEHQARAGGARRGDRRLSASSSATWAPPASRSGARPGCPSTW